MEVCPKDLWAMLYYLYIKHGLLVSYLQVDDDDQSISDEPPIPPARKQKVRWLQDNIIYYC